MVAWTEREQYVCSLSCNCFYDRTFWRMENLAFVILLALSYRVAMDKFLKKKVLNI